MSLLAAVVTMSPAHGAGSIGFGPVSLYRASPFSVSSVYGAGQIASADIDGDGARDLVVSDCNGSEPVVLPNEGGGRFGAVRSVPTGTDACVVGTADVNRDGIDDVVAGSSRTNDVTVLVGDGAGGFTPSGRYPVTGTPVMQVAFADFDGDSFTDTAVLTNSPGTVTLLSGRGDGTFFPRSATSAATLAMSFTVGDFDGDGRPDLAVGDAAGNGGFLRSDVVVLRNTGDATFAVGGRYPVGSSPEGLASGDLDGDGLVDVAAANANTSDLSLLWGRGDATFDPEQRIPGACLVCGKPGIRLADFDHDGLLDIASTATVSSRVDILRGAGLRQFVRVGAVATTDLLPITGAIGPQMFVADDLDGDGFADLAVAGYLPSLDLADLLAGRPLVTRVAVALNSSG